MDFVTSLQVYNWVRELIAMPALEPDAILRDPIVMKRYQSRLMVERCAFRRDATA